MGPLQFTVTQRFPVPLDRLWGACSRIDYVEGKYRALGATSVRVLEFRVEPEAITVVVERMVPMAPRRFAARWPAVSLVLRHRTRWVRSGPGRAEVQVELLAVGIPLRAEATGELEDLPSGSTRMCLRWSVLRDASWMTASMQRLFATQVREALRRDHAFTMAYLRDAR